MRRAERLFQLVLLLRRGPVTTAKRLAENLEVSERTVYRDIHALIGSGVPIEGEAGVGYVLRSGFELPPMMFDAEEAKALVLGARMVQAWGDPTLEKAAHRVVEKVMAVAPPSVQEALEDNTVLVPTFHVDKILRESIGTIRKATVDRRKIRFDYTREDGNSTVRTVRPLCLFYWGTVWSLGAWCDLRDALRTFRVDRMEELEVLEARFSKEKGKELEDYLRGFEEGGR